MIVDKLYESVAKKGVVCVGLDTDISYVPEYLQKEAGSAGEAVFLFNKAIIDATEDVAGCYKVQIAYYESLGLEGMEAYRKTLAYLRDKKLISSRILNGATLPKPPKCMQRVTLKGTLRRTL